MKSLRFPPFARKARLNPWQPNHVFVLAGPEAFDQAEHFFNVGQCQPAIAVPDNATPSLYEWPVRGMDVTVKDYGSSDAYAEELCYSLLKAGAALVVFADAETGAISVHRPDEVPGNA